MKIKNLFPILKNNPGLVYLDNAATTQKPKQVIDSIYDYYSSKNSNIHRGLYSLAENTTILYESARHKVAKFINAEVNEVIFNSGTTEGVNFISQAWAKKNIKEGDEILVTCLEHHSNFLPWQNLAQENNAFLKIVPLNEKGFLDYDVFRSLITDKTKLIALTYQSNVTGEILDISKINSFIKNLELKNRPKLFIDAAQIVSHKRVDVKFLECDFLVFSAHKMFGPTGVGVLYISKYLHNQVAPYRVGGGMVFEVSQEGSSWLKSPHKFEAGTPAISQVIGLGAAIDFINENIDFDILAEHEKHLSDYLVDQLANIDLVQFIVDKSVFKNGHVVSFNIKNMHAHDVAAYLDKFNICVRAGHHCAQILHKFLGLSSSIRVSVSAYNTKEDIDLLINAISALSKNI